MPMENVWGWRITGSISSLPGCHREPKAREPLAGSAVGLHADGEPLAGEPLAGVNQTADVETLAGVGRAADVEALAVPRCPELPST